MGRSMRSLSCRSTDKALSVRRQCFSASLREIGGFTPFSVHQNTTADKPKIRPWDHRPPSPSRRAGGPIWPPSDDPVDHRDGLSEAKNVLYLRSAECPHLEEPCRYRMIPTLTVEVTFSNRSGTICLLLRALGALLCRFQERMPIISRNAWRHCPQRLFDYLASCKRNSIISFFRPIICWSQKR